MPLSRDDVPADVLEQVNAALNRARDNLGLTNDAQLAKAWGVGARTISFWRNGIWHDTDAVLIGFLLGRPFWRARPQGQRRTSTEQSAA